MIDKIISGGQTGVDRAGLDAALEFGITCGGWCPLGRKAEDGVIPTRYPLQETQTEDYAERTRKNVQDADGVLVLLRSHVSGGTALTIEAARQLGKPVSIVKLTDPRDCHAVRAWVRHERIRTLEIAGPRESQEPGIYASSLDYLRELLA